ncbi:hypothetical protein HPP92_005274 [Vanilla planifolia]|uniref:CASP-like protein n=1 Tax=Vanilla planifolia TaxID=51239 RepID=A0A835VD14_VANPL|nr:hypothetical protein HPP92_005274 [Vanilla planifolia]
MDTHTSRVASSVETAVTDKSFEHPARVSNAARRKKQPGIKLQIAIRVLAAMATLAAALLMFLSEQKTEFFGLSIIANYKFSPAFKFFVIGNAVACAYAVLSLTAVGCCGSTLPCVQFLDTLAMGLVMAAAAAATAVGYIGKKGNSVAMWNANLAK